MDTATTAPRFRETITSFDELRALLGEPSELAVRKQLDRLDAHCRAFIERASFALVGTSGADGRCDVSPRGDPPGFALVLDDTTIVLPERPGNRRADGLRNIIENPHVGVLFIVPGVEETLRVNGRAVIVRDAGLLVRMAVEGKRPLLAVAVTVEECFLHCAKSFKRGHVWDTAAWTPRSALPSLGRIAADQVPSLGVTGEQIDRALVEDYKKLY